MTLPGAGEYKSDRVPGVSTVTEPQAFGQYDLLERISAGGMAEVFRARDNKTGRLVALKRILPSVAMDEDFITMFEDEARIASQLEHPHIARTLDFGHVGTTYYIAFEYVNGKNLRVLFDHSVSHNEPPPLSFSIYVFTRIGEGLSYAHSRKDAKGMPVSIVHRDVSPQNIVVSFRGDIKLIDFGIAKAAGKLSRTEVGAIKGKFGYMSPEQFAGEAVDQRTDVFSLGICMWELLAGRRLYDGPNEMAILTKMRDTRIEPPSSLNPEVPPQLDGIVCKALAKNPDERYRSAKELYRDLNALSKDTNTVATREQIAHYMRRTFPEPGTPSSSVPRPGLEGSSDDLANATIPSSVARVQETVEMAAENKGGSDLDVFEGLGKKNSTRVPVNTPSSAPRNGPPPPPPSVRSAPPGPPPITDGPPQTLRGVTAAGKAVPSAPLPPPRSPPPPPPGRGALPVVVPPPSRPPFPASQPPSGSKQIAASPSEADTRPTAQGAKLDMDWDDDNEETHVFDKEEKPSEVQRSAPPSSSLPSTSTRSRPPPPPPPSQNLAQNKRTLIGVQSPFSAPPPPPPPPGPPPTSTRSPIPPPPPSSVGGAFARASSIPSAVPGPVAHPPPPPPPTIDPRPVMPPPPSANPFNATQPELPPQASTVPMPMPGPRSVPADRMPDMPPPPQMMNRMEATALVRPQESRTGLILGLATAVIVAVVVVFFLVPRKGSILVSATDAKGDVTRVDVYIDGKKTDCAISPCIEEIGTGSHIVKVVADGYAVVPEQTVTVESRDQARAAFALTATGEGGTGVKAGGTQQPGVKLYIDDREIGLLPAEVHDLTPGSHRIRIAGGDRYTPVERNVTVAQNELQDLGTTTLKVTKGKATITPGTPGAKVYIVSGTDRRELPTLPISVDIDTSKQWSLVATKPGYSDYNQAISFDDGQAEKTFAISLEPRQASAPPPWNPAPQPAPQPVAHTTHTSAPSTPSTPSTDNAGTGGEGFLNINSIPASSIVLDGKPIGNTPKLKYSVSPGAHTVLFVNSEQGFKKTVNVTVGAGETKPAIGKGD